MKGINTRWPHGGHQVFVMSQRSDFQKGPFWQSFGKVERATELLLIVSKQWSSEVCVVGDL